MFNKGSDVKNIIEAERAILLLEQQQIDAVRCQTY
jgi:hypothetical protein